MSAFHPRDTALIRKLSGAVTLTPDDRSSLDWLCEDVRTFKAGRVLSAQGEHSDDVFILSSGWAQRHKSIGNGQRQVLAYLMPGDLSDIHAPTLQASDHTITLLTNAEVAVIPRDRMVSVIERNPTIVKAFIWSMLVEKSIMREWLLNIGRREAYERLAHLFYELFARLKLVGLVDDDDSFALPLTQSQLGESTSMTAVHVNRTLARLRAERVIELKHRRLRICDPDRLAMIAGFDNGYLHLADGGTPIAAPRSRYFQ